MLPKVLGSIVCPLLKIRVNSPGSTVRTVAALMSVPSLA